MLRFFLPLLLIASFLNAASASPAATSTTADVANAARTIRVRIDADLHLGAGGAVVSGVTNLPARTVLIIGLADEAYASRDPDGFYAQANVSVRMGKFRSERFTYRGRPLPRGRYRVDVSMAFARFQPPSVKVVIGRRGQALTGPLVEQDAVFGASVVSEQWFAVR
jgi:hypothetical protein